MTPQDPIVLEPREERAAVEAPFEQARESNRRTKSFAGWRGRYVACGKNKPRDDERKKKEGPVAIRFYNLQGAEIQHGRKGRQAYRMR